MEVQNTLDISVVIPLFNEEESLPELISRLVTQVSNLVGNNYELIFIDDGSTDNSLSVLKQQREVNNCIKILSFRRNYGKSAALAVGFELASGNYVFTMDADLQDAPEEVPNLLAKLKEGYDLVSGWKKVRHDPISKTIPSRFFNYITSLMSGVKLHDFNCGLKGYRNEVIKSLEVYGEMHRYLPALAHWDGFKVTEIPVQHFPRVYGYSKFGFSRFFKGFLDLLTVLFTTRFVKRPLHLFGTVGTLMALCGITINGYLTLSWFINNISLSNRPLTLFGVALIIVGIQLVSVGLLGELIVKKSLQNENYSIKERIV
ncbi:MAG: glycosyltransferase [Candidatus Kapabacteria bacterium]|nr:glycosyltransferase [Candidatus Kapabacteria bacterium]